MNSLINLNILLSNSSNLCFSVCKVSCLISKFELASFHTSRIEYKFGPSKPRPTVYKKPVDWLPFPWHRRPRFNLYEKSGDNIKEVLYDPTAPKPDFELSEELKTADDTIKYKYSLATASKSEKKEVHKREILKRIQRHPFDFNSIEVKIALKTLQIRSLYEHHRDFEKRYKRVSHFVFPIIIQKRNKMLTKLYYMDEARFNWLIKELDLYYDPRPMGIVNSERYCKKWDLRRMTREYCAKMVADKKTAYHEELKKEQQAFLEEKEKILAWIEAEEKELNSFDS